MNTWWNVADLLDSPNLLDVEEGLGVVVGSEMPPEVKAEAEALLKEVAALQAKVAAHSKHVLSKMDGVMWPVSVGWPRS